MISLSPVMMNASAVATRRFDPAQRGLPPREQTHLTRRYCVGFNSLWMRRGRRKEEYGGDRSFGHVPPLGG